MNFHAIFFKSVITLKWDWGMILADFKFYLKITMFSLMQKISRNFDLMYITFMRKNHDYDLIHLNHHHHTTSFDDRRTTTTKQYCRRNEKCV